MSWTDGELRLARRMAAAGYTYGDIAKRLGKKKKTVAGYMNLHRETVSPRKYTKSEGAQLCWDCAKASGGGDCEWANSRCRETVPGWTAREVEPRSQVSLPGKWYRITECPKFERG